MDTQRLQPFNDYINIEYADDLADGEDFDLLSELSSFYEMDASVPIESPFVADEAGRVVRPAGQAEGQGTTYGFAGWQGAVQTLAASGTIQPTALIIPVAGSGGAVTLTSNPSIANGVAGQILVIKGTSDTNTLTLTNATNGMQMSGNITLGANDTIGFYYDGTDWIELFRTNT